ncbi:ribonuclease H-like domain-containing protein [Tanacetum coccineum]
MTNSEHPSPPPTLTLVEKLYAVHNINSLIPKKLDLAESNYSTWSYFFKDHCLDMSDDDVVTYAINGLSDKYGSLAQIIAHKDPFPDLATVRSMVATEELRLRSRSSVLPTGTTSSAPQVLLAEASSRNQTGWNNRERDNRTTTRDVCRNFGRGFCCWGDACRFLHDSSRSSGSTPANGQATLLPQAFNTMTLRDPTDANWNMDTGAITGTPSKFLLRCDSTGDLYPVTSLSYPQAFLVGQQTWHQRLGHPLGKHVRLPFSLSEIVVKSPFEIIHSDLWTSPLSSVSGIKYYALFFALLVGFQCDIKSLQCDHGGEFDNNALHQLFATNGSDLNTDKIIPSRHVTFDETRFPYGSMTPDASPPYNFLDTDPNLIQKHMLHNMPTVGSSPVAATRQPTSPSPQPTSTSAHSTGPPTNQPTNHSTLQPTPSAPTNPTPTTNLPPTNSIPPTPPPVPSPATTQPNRNPASTHSMVTRYRVGTNRPTQRYTLSVSTISPIPKSYNHAFQDPHWYRAMLDEYNALIKNNTWILVPRPSDANIVCSLWLFWYKYNADGTLNRYKACLVANGNTQLTGIDVDETFSPVVKPATIRTVLSLALSRHWPVYQLDVKNSFLHGSLSETVYMHQPFGFRDSQHPDHVCLLQRSLYGLKQAPRAWFQRFAAYAARVGFIHSRCNSSLFIHRRGSDTAYLLLYVDDIILTASSTTFLQSIIATLHAEFSMTDLGPLNYFLGISMTRNTLGMFLSQ